MLNLDSKLVLTREAIQSPNLCDRFAPDDLSRIGVECSAGYDRDERSRQHWLERNEAGMNLALQIQEDKNFPWPGCSNVAFPLVTIAAQQFHARAYPAIVGTGDVVKCKVIGEDPDGSKTRRAEKVSTDMSWQLLEQDKCWEDQEDKALLNVSIVGTNFKKTRRDSSLGHNVSELVLAKNLVLNYWAKSVEHCPRKTHLLPMFRNEVYENCMAEKWRDVLDEAWYKSLPAQRTTRQRTEQDNRQGVTQPQPDFATPFCFCEQHANLDLDQDGYDEPYIITFERASRSVVRIAARFDDPAAITRVASGKNSGKVLRIEATEYFTKKTFIPSPDGGIYDIGFGVFLGPLNETVNSLINMLVDCGTMQTTSGGFLGRGAKIRGGVYTVAPFEWKRVDSTGDDLRKSIFPMPVNEPSPVLFQLLGLLIDYTSRVSGTTDIQVGESPGQNTPAETSRNLMEMGQKIYTAIFKRIWRASKEEFCKLYKLNGIYLPPGERELYQGSGDDIYPVADPNITSESMRVQLAGTLVTRAGQTGGYNKDEVEKRFLKALRVDGIEVIYPGTQGQPPPEDPKVTLQKVKDAAAAQRQQAELQARQQEFVIEMQQQQLLDGAKILELQAQAMNEAANAETEKAYAQVAMINAEIGRMKILYEHRSKLIAHALEAARIQSDHHIGIKGLAVDSARKEAA